MSKERLEELEELFEDISNDMMPPYVGITPDTVVDVKRVIKYAKEKAERVQELEKEFELCDSTIKKYYEDDCIHCNGKGFNGLDYCPNCTRGAVIQENLQLEQQNKRYREALEKIKLNVKICGNEEYFPKVVEEIVNKALEESE